MTSRHFAIASLSLITLVATVGHASSATFNFLAAGNGSLKGTVKTAKGTPAAACPIKFFAPVDYAGTGRGGAKGKSALDVTTPEPSLLQGKTTVAAQAVSDEKGNFALKSLKPGTYRYLAGNRATGMAGGSVTIEADKGAEVEIKLNEVAR